jgi:hypothetical protein
MKITKSRLKEIIREEVNRLKEGAIGGTTYAEESGAPPMQLLSPEEIETLKALLSKLSSALDPGYSRSLAHKSPLELNPPVPPGGEAPAE